MINVISPTVKVTSAAKQADASGLIVCSYRLDQFITIAALCHVGYFYKFEAVLCTYTL